MKTFEKLFRRFLKGDEGVTAIEFSLLATPFIFIAIGITDEGPDPSRSRDPAGSSVGRDHIHPDLGQSGSTATPARSTGRPGCPTR